MYSNKPFSFLLPCFLMSVLLSACGSKGDLYQVAEPETPSKTVVTPVQSNSEASNKKQQ